MKLHHIAIVLFTLLFTLTGCTSLAPPSHTQSPAEQTTALVNHLNSVTVALVAITPKGEIRPYCTGVWVDDNTLVTANHCVAAAYELKLRVHKADEDEDDELELPTSLVGTNVYYVVLGEVDQVDTSPFAVHASTALVADKSHDIAVLRARGKVIPPHDNATLASVAPPVGSTLHVVGQVRGLYWSYVKGVVSAYRDSLSSFRTPANTKGPFVQVSGPVYFGNSGGGAFNDAGELVGIASFLGGAPVTAMFIHFETVQKALDTARAPVITTITIEIK